jgi:hypothetical protein
MGPPRSGTTWLANLLATVTGAALVDEPLIGAHLAAPLGTVLSIADPRDPLLLETNAARPAYVFSDESAWAWRPALRSLLLRRFAAAAIDARRWRRAAVVVKEPNGSLAAPMLAATLPRSRLLFVVRDGRDVVDSSVDGAAGGWITETHGTRLEADQRGEFMRRRAHHWVRTIEAVQRAYDAHDERLRLRVAYEELLADPVSGVGRIVRWLGRDDVLADVPSVVDRMRFDRLPQEQTGPGRFARAATPGLWREHFSADEQQVLDEIMGPTLTALGYR